jgi:hypothetical protein
MQEETLAIQQLVTFCGLGQETQILVMTNMKGESRQQDE